SGRPAPRRARGLPPAAPPRPPARPRTARNPWLPAGSRSPPEAGAGRHRERGRRDGGPPAPPSPARTPGGTGEPAPPLPPAAAPRAQTPGWSPASGSGSLRREPPRSPATGRPARRAGREHRQQEWTNGGVDERTRSVRSAASFLPLVHSSILLRTPPPPLPA